MTTACICWFKLWKLTYNRWNKQYKKFPRLVAIIGSVRTYSCKVHRLIDLLRCFIRSDLIVTGIR
jgi:hypothetical protein